MNKLPKIWICMINGRAPSPIRHPTATAAKEAAIVMKAKYDEKHDAPCKVAIFEMTHYLDASGSLTEMEPI